VERAVLQTAREGSDSLIRYELMYQRYKESLHRLRKKARQICVCGGTVDAQR
jgi:hypothetical protein